MAKTTTTKEKSKKQTKKTSAKATTSAKTTKAVAKKAPAKSATTSKKASASKKETSTEVAPKIIKTSPAVARRGGIAKLFARGSTPSGVRKLYVISVLIFTLLAAVAGVFMHSAHFDLSLGYLTSNELLSQGGTVFAPAERVMYSLDIRWLTVAVLALSAVFSVVGASRMRRSSAEIASGVPQPWRWADAAITGAGLVAIVAILSGIQGLLELKLLAILTAVAFAFAWITERENYRSPTFVRGAYWASVGVGALVLLALVVYAVTTPLYGMVRFPWYTYALGGALVLGSVIAVFERYRAFNRQGSWASPLFLERNFVLTNLLVKVAAGAILIAGFWK